MWRPSRLLLLACPMLLAFPTLAEARIRTPTIEELVDSADLIVIGRVTSVQETPQELHRHIAVTSVIGIAVLLAGFLIWRRRWSLIVILAAISLLGISLFDTPPGTYRKVAFVSISSTISGVTLAAEIPVSYHNGFLCDVTTFAAGKEYLLFLKKGPSGYTLSWYDWGEWLIENGCAQTERRTWDESAAPLPLAEFIARIRDIRTNRTTKSSHSPGLPAARLSSVVLPPSSRPLTPTL